jgi:hypothetical protein
LPALRAVLPLPSLPPGRFLVLISVKRLIRLQAHSAAGRIRSIEKSNDLIGDRTRYLLTCSIVPHPTTLSRALSSCTGQIIFVHELHQVYRNNICDVASFIDLVSPIKEIVHSTRVINCILKKNKQQFCAHNGNKIFNILCTHVNADLGLCKEELLGRTNGLLSFHCILSI